VSWTGPLDNPKSWLDQPSVRQPRPNDLKARAVELCKTYKRRKVAEMLGVDKSTIYKWLQKAKEGR
jgi:transposase